MLDDIAPLRKLIKNTKRGAALSIKKWPKHHGVVIVPFTIEGNRLFFNFLWLAIFNAFSRVSMGQ